MTKTSKPRSKDTQSIDSKPILLAKLIYPAILRMIKAKKHQDREQNAKFMLDSDRKRRVNVVTNID